MYNKNDVVVFTPDLARKLLHKGYTIKDIKPDKLDPDHKRSIFIFQDEDGIRDDLWNLIEEKKRREIRERRGGDQGC